MKKKTYIDKKGDWTLKVTVIEAAKVLGRKGGLATKKKYGKKHYQKLAENMNKKKQEAKLLKESV